jgi:hypothetical protein
MAGRTALKTASSKVRRALPGLLTPSARRCRAKFLGYFRGGFTDPEYCELERNYKWKAHQRWDDELNPSAFRALLKGGEFKKIAATAVAIEGRTNLLFSFEKMALRDAVKSVKGARAFSFGLFDFLHGRQSLDTRLERWCEVVDGLPRKQTRVLTWPVVTIMGFIAQPDVHFFLKPTVTRTGAEKYGLPFHHKSRPNWATYEEVLGIAKQIKFDLRDLRPRDLIDLQSFLWIMGSDEYPD